MKNILMSLVLLMGMFVIVPVSMAEEDPCPCVDEDGECTTVCPEKTGE